MVSTKPLTNWMLNKSNASSFRSHVLLMEFLGSEEGGWTPAPRLHDVADLSESRARQLYWDLALDVRKMYHTCQLVHGDLSEYNILFHR